MKFGIFLQHYFPYGGLQRDAVRLAEAAVEAGDTPVLIVSTWDGPKPDDIEIIELNSGGKSNHRRAERFASDCQRMYQKEQLDTAICFSRVPGTPFHFCGDPCYKEKFTRTKSSITKILPRYKFLLKNEAAVFGADSGTHIFYLAASEIPAYKAFYPLEKRRYTLLPPWLKRPKQFSQNKELIKEALTKEIGIPSDSKILLFVGSDFHRKGLDRAIDALSELNDQTIHLVACGQYPGDSFNKQARQLGVEAQVHILGPRDDVPEWMYTSDLLIHPARQETAGMVLLEALTYGLPVLCTENCGYALAVSEAGMPSLSPDSSAQEISSKFNQIIQQKSKLQQSLLDWNNNQPLNAAEIVLQTMSLSQSKIV